MPWAPGKEKHLARSLGGKPIVVIGGGIGGLVSALDLASAGLEVILIEKEQTLGGKIRQIDCAGKGVDSGPTVFTMRWIFEKLFADCNENFDSEFELEDTDNESGEDEEEEEEEEEEEGEELGAKLAAHGVVDGATVGVLAGKLRHHGLHDLAHVFGRARAGFSNRRGYRRGIVLVAARGRHGRLTSMPLLRQLEMSTQRRVGLHPKPRDAPTHGDRYSR